MICAASALVLRQKKIEEVLLERVCHWRCWMGENPPELISYIHILHNIRLKCDKIKTIAIAKTLNRAVRAAQVVHKLLLQGRSAHSEVFLPFLCPQTYHISSDSDLIQLYGLFYYCYYYYCYYYCIGHSWEKESAKRSTKLLRGGERSWNDAFRRTRRETSRFFFLQLRSMGNCIKNSNNIVLRSGWLNISFAALKCAPGRNKFTFHRSIWSYIVLFIDWSSLKYWLTI